VANEARDQHYLTLGVRRGAHGMRSETRMLDFVLRDPKG